MSRDATIDATSTGTWQEIAGLVDELADLTKRDLLPSEFHAELLDRVVRASAAAAGVVWWRSGEGQLVVARQINLPSLVPAADGDDLPWHRKLAERVANSCQPTVVAPHSRSADGELENPSEFAVLLQTIELEGRSLGVVQIFLHADRSPAVLRGNQQLLSVICELGADFHRHRLLRQLRDFEQQQQLRDEFVRRVLQNLDLDPVAFAVANEGRRVIDCDRVSVLRCDRRASRLLCISGVDTIDRRATAVRAMEQLVQQVFRDNESLWFDNAVNDSSKLPVAAREYMSEVRVSRLGVLLLRPAATAPSPVANPIAALVVEEFGAQSGPSSLDEVQRRASWVVEHSVAPLDAARRMDALSWLRFSPSRSPGHKWILAVCALAALGTLALIPIDFDIVARGELQPVERQVVYAPRDGIVRALPAIAHSRATPTANDGMDVRRGDVLVELQNIDLDREVTTLLGERSTRRQQLDTVSVTLEQTASSAKPNDQTQTQELSGSMLELTIMLASIEERLAILRREQAKLAITAAIDGRVQTWDVVSQLQSRPVRQGQRLMTVVDVGGPWELRLHVSDKDVGYVSAAMRESAGLPPITFLQKSAPEQVYRGRLRHLAMTTEVDETYGAMVRATAAIDEAQQLAELRPGATVIAKIHCGRRPLSFVWLRDLIESIRTRVLF